MTPIPIRASSDIQYLRWLVWDDKYKNVKLNTSTRKCQSKVNALLGRKPMNVTPDDVILLWNQANSVAGMRMFVALRSHEGWYLLPNEFFEANTPDALRATIRLEPYQYPMDMSSTECLELTRKQIVPRILAAKPKLKRLEKRWMDIYNSMADMLGIPLSYVPKDPYSYCQSILFYLIETKRKKDATDPETLEVMLKQLLGF